ncbi:hypothetical protein COBT_001265 [Conglomerata obtusa]
MAANSKMFILLTMTTSAGLLSYICIAAIIHNKHRKTQKKQGSVITPLVEYKTGENKAEIANLDCKNIKNVCKDQNDVFVKKNLMCENRTKKNNEECNVLRTHSKNKKSNISDIVLNNNRTKSVRNETVVTTKSDINKETKVSKTLLSLGKDNFAKSFLSCKRSSNNNLNILNDNTNSLNGQGSQKTNQCQFDKIKSKCSLIINDNNRLDTNGKAVTEYENEICKSKLTSNTNGVDIPTVFSIGKNDLKSDHDKFSKNYNITESICIDNKRQEGVTNVPKNIIRARPCLEIADVQRIYDKKILNDIEKSANNASCQEIEQNIYKTDLLKNNEMIISNILATQFIKPDINSIYSYNNAHSTDTKHLSNLLQNLEYKSSNENENMDLKAYQKDKNCESMQSKEFDKEEFVDIMSINNLTVNTFLHIKGNHEKSFQHNYTENDVDENTKSCCQSAISNDNVRNKALEEFNVLNESSNTDKVCAKVNLLDENPENMSLVETIDNQAIILSTQENDHTKINNNKMIEDMHNLSQLISNKNEDLIVYDKKSESGDINETEIRINELETDLCNNKNNNDDKRFLSKNNNSDNNKYDGIEVEDLSTDVNLYRCYEKNDFETDQTYANSEISISQKDVEIKECINNDESINNNDVTEHENKNHESIQNLTCLGQTTIEIGDENKCNPIRLDKIIGLDLNKEITTHNLPSIEENIIELDYDLAKKHDNDNKIEDINNISLKANNQYNNNEDPECYNEQKCVGKIAISNGLCETANDDREYILNDDQEAIKNVEKENIDIIKGKPNLQENDQDLKNLLNEQNDTKLNNSNLETDHGQCDIKYNESEDIQNCNLESNENILSPNTIGHKNESEHNSLNNSANDQSDSTSDSIDFTINYDQWYVFPDIEDIVPKLPDEPEENETILKSIKKYYKSEGYCYPYNDVNWEANFKKKYAELCNKECTEEKSGSSCLDTQNVRAYINSLRKKYSNDPLKEGDIFNENLSTLNTAIMPKKATDECIEENTIEDVIDSNILNEELVKEVLESKNLKNNDLIKIISFYDERIDNLSEAKNIIISNFEQNF